MAYLVLGLRAGESASVEGSARCRTLRLARSRAWQLACRLRPRWLRSRPVWCEGSCWHGHPDAEGMVPVGGYDVGDDGSAAVIYRREED